ncbi:hypothetical protein QZH41_007387 [Actinostola sp. cb2023]|nr:hypothetical protein QZH41_007387 [Actinostola sp. cb2023]
MVLLIINFVLIKFYMVLDTQFTLASGSQPFPRESYDIDPSQGVLSSQPFPRESYAIDPSQGVLNSHPFPRESYAIDPSQGVLSSQPFPRESYAIDPSQGVLNSHPFPRESYAIDPSQGVLSSQPFPSESYAIDPSQGVLSSQPFPRESYAIDPSQGVLSSRSFPRESYAIDPSQGVLSSRSFPRESYAIDPSQGVLSSQPFPRESYAIDPSQGVLSSRPFPRESYAIDPSQGVLSSQPFPSESYAIDPSQGVLSSRSFPRESYAIDPSQGVLNSQPFPRESYTIDPSQGVLNSQPFPRESYAIDPSQGVLRSHPFPECLSCAYTFHTSSGSVDAKVVARYDTKLDDELCLHVGGIVTNIHMSGPNYWTGNLGDTRGFFPKSCVELVRQVMVMVEMMVIVIILVIIDKGDGADDDDDSDDDGAIENDDMMQMMVVMCKFHSVFLSQDGRVFTCGHGRGGRLGHNNEQTQLVTSLYHKDISIAMVACGDSATVCATSRGDIFVLSQYTCHKVVTRFPELTRLVVSEGDVELNTNQEIIKHHEKLTLTMLNGNGLVEEHVLPAHMFILASKSPKFHQLLITNSEVSDLEETIRTVKLDDVDYHDLTKYLEDLYSGHQIDDTLLFGNKRSHKATRNNTKQVDHQNTNHVNGLDDKSETISGFLQGLESLSLPDLDDFSTPTKAANNGLMLNDAAQISVKMNKKKLEKKNGVSDKSHKNRYNRWSEDGDDGVGDDDDSDDDDGVGGGDDDGVGSGDDNGGGDDGDDNGGDGVGDDGVGGVDDDDDDDGGGDDGGGDDDGGDGDGGACPELHDVTIESEDGVQFLCHKCVLIARLVSHRNAMELLEFSCIYNAYQLKDACLEFICNNLASLLEAGYLSLLNEETLNHLSKAYKDAIPRMPWRILTPQFDHVFALTPEPSSSPSKRRRSSGRKRSVKSESEAEGDADASIQDGENREPKSRESIIDGVFEIAETENEKEITEKQDESESAEAEDEVKEKVNGVCSQSEEGNWYRKKSDTHEHHRTPGTTSSPTKTNEQTSPTTSTPKEIPKTKPRDQQPSTKCPWVATATSPPLSGLRAIMEQELLTSQTPAKSVKSPSVAKVEVKGKQSQKQRKKVRMLQENSADVSETKLSSQETPTKDTNPPVNPWALPDKTPSPVRSLRQLIEQEEKSQLMATANASPSKAKTNDKTKDKAVNKTKMSWGLRHLEQTKVKVKVKVNEDNCENIEPTSPRKYDYNYITTANVKILSSSPANSLALLGRKSAPALLLLLFRLLTFFTYRNEKTPNYTASSSFTIIINNAFIITITIINNITIIINNAFIITIIIINSIINITIIIINNNIIITILTITHVFTLVLPALQKVKENRFVARPLR